MKWWNSAVLVPEGGRGGEIWRTKKVPGKLLGWPFRHTPWQRWSSPAEGSDSTLMDAEHHKTQQKKKTEQGRTCTVEDVSYYFQEHDGDLVPWLIFVNQINFFRAQLCHHLSLVIVHSLHVKHLSSGACVTFTGSSMQRYCFHSHHSHTAIFPGILQGLEVGNWRHRLIWISISAPLHTRPHRKCSWTFQGRTACVKGFQGRLEEEESRRETQEKTKATEMEKCSYWKCSESQQETCARECARWPVSVFIWREQRRWEENGKSAQDKMSFKWKCVWWGRWGGGREEGERRKWVEAKYGREEWGERRGSRGEEKTRNGRKRRNGG